MKYTDYPRKTAKKQYDYAIESLQERLRPYLSVKAMYQIGGVSCPGISDIDLILVMKASAEAPDVKREINEWVKEWAGPVVHYPFIIPETLVKDLAYLMEIYEMKHITGKKYTFSKPTTKQKKYLKLAMIIDYTTLFWTKELPQMVYAKKTGASGLAQKIGEDISELARFKHSPTLSIRTILLKLHSFCYELLIAQELTKKNPKWTAFIQKVKSLRKNWFQTKNRIKLLNDLTHQSLDILYELIALSDKLAKKVSKSGLKKPFTLTTNYFSHTFLPKWSADISKKETKQYYKSHASIKGFLPQTFLVQLLNAHLPEHVISKEELKKLQKAKVSNKSYASVLKKRYDSLHKQVRFLTEIEFDQGQFFSFAYPFSHNLAYDLYFKLYTKLKRLST